MNVLLAGITGQLGAGVVESHGPGDPGIFALVRSMTKGPRRLKRLAPDHDFPQDRFVEGDVSLPLWGLDDAALDGLAQEVDAVVNLAGQTDWAAPWRSLHAANVLGALHGLELARTLRERGGRCRGYVHAGSFTAAGGLEGWIAEAPFGPDPDRTPYEQSKWLGEQALLEPGAARDGLSVVVARVGGLIGHSVTGRTAKRNSLYLVEDIGTQVPFGVLPIVLRGRVDMLPRDRAGRLMLDLVAGVLRHAPADPQIVHLCAGETAPTMASLFSALRAIDTRGSLSLPRLVPVPSRGVLAGVEALRRWNPMPSLWSNAITGMRYVTFDRLFERSKLAALVDAELPSCSAEEVARIVFAPRDGTPAPARLESTLGRYAA